MPIKNTISHKATLVSVNISVWTARKLDRKVTKETNDRYTAHQDAGRYNKLLIEAKRLEKITTLGGAARSLHYRMTKPWLDEARLLPNSLYSEFTNEFRRIKREFEVAVDAFCVEFPTFVAERRVALNGMFDETDYPSERDIRSKFRLELKFSPVPDVADFRSDLDPELAADIAAEITAASTQAVDNVVTNTAQQIAEVVGHMANKLNEFGEEVDGKKRTFRDLLVGNVRELARLLPAFNITNDPVLAEIGKRIKQDLCVEEPKALRDHPEVRKAVKKSADEIVAEVSKFLS